MKTNNEIRVDNMRALQLEAGSQKKMVEITGMSQSLISQYCGDEPSKAIGDKVARRLEEKFKKETGWMDHIHKAIYQIKEEQAIYNKISNLSEETRQQALEYLDFLEAKDSHNA